MYRNVERMVAENRGIYDDESATSPVLCFAESHLALQRVGSVDQSTGRSDESGAGGG